MKQLGVTHLVSISTAGSLKEEIHPGELIVPDQFIDRTFKRPQTFFGDGIVVHASLASPLCANLAASVLAAPRHGGAIVHEGGTYLCLEVPQFSLRPETNLFRRLRATLLRNT